MCRDCRRSNPVAFDVIALPDETLFPDIVKLHRFRCSECGSRQAVATPDWRGMNAPGAGGMRKCLFAEPQGRTVVTRAISIDEIISASLKGVVNAQNTYKIWSGGQWLWNAPEYFTTVCIATEIAKTDRTWVTLEDSATSTLKDAGAKGRGKLHSDLRANGRVDIVVWWSYNAKPRAIIEVKCQTLSLRPLNDDLKRISSVIRKNSHQSSIQFGASVFYLSCGKGKNITAKDRLQRAINKIASDARAEYRDDCHVSIEQTTICDERDSAWAGAALVLKAKN